MMKVEDRRCYMDAVNSLSGALLGADIKRWNQASKLRAYNLLLEPPEGIRQAVAAKAKRLKEESSELSDLYNRLARLRDKLLVLPSWGEVEYFDGHKGKLIYKGLLPDFEPASENEAEALRMLADYYKEKGL